MELHDSYVPDEQFTAFLETMPQVCVELVLETEAGILVGKRTGKPRVWFWPGGRLYKGERLDDAAHRIAAEELGIDVSLEERLGVQAHFWDPEAVDEAVSRHTVNVVYRATPASAAYDIELDDQHEAYRFLTELEPDLHEYVREYLTSYELLSDDGTD
jgi:colanic acid biosynthesis protein WcaH